MNCRATTKLFSSYIESELSETQRRQVVAHLGGCMRCAGEVEKLRKTMSLIRWIPRPEVDPVFTRRVMTRVRSEPARTGWRTWLRGHLERLTPEWPGLEVGAPALASAAILGAVAGVVIALELQPGSSVDAGAELAASSGEIVGSPAARSTTMPSTGPLMVVGHDAGLAGQMPEGWGGQGRLEGPLPVTEVEYVLRQIQLGGEATELPAGVHVENGYVTF